VGLTDEVRDVIDQGLALVSPGSDASTSLSDARASLDGPLKIAVAGRVKAGKSTLVNALIGDRVAPTDAGECTQIVTWFSDGLTYRVQAVVGEERRQLAFHRDSGSLEIDLGSLSPGEIDRIDVDWPTAALRSLTIIDTPGIGSINTETSDRALEFLTPDDERATEADAVLYLMRHAHQSDADFLESFHDEQVSQAAPLNAIAVLSRADEIGVGRLDAMDSARKIAAAYAVDPKIRRLCATVVPVAGLLAQAGAALRESEFQAFRSLASLPEPIVGPMLWSADRFVDPAATDALTGEERVYLMEQFGLFGVRVALAEISTGRVNTATDLSTALIEKSGILRLREVLSRSFTDRRDLLIVRSVLLKLDSVVGAEPALTILSPELERLRASAHELTEARFLNMLRGGAVSLSADRALELERLLGGDGTDCRSRLGLAPESAEDIVREALSDALIRQQKRAESSLGGQEARDFARVAVRTCEGLLADLSGRT
jgi:predicted GTPase